MIEFHSESARLNRDEIFKILYFVYSEVNKLVLVVCALKAQ